ncbi:MAG: 50S ribosomal protein L10 [Arsenophonus sp.]|nr:MAG: 50S ribosomal protein L10 [Arsenophonus sp.]
MILKYKKKTAILSEIRHIIENSLSVVIANFKKINVNNMTKLRRDARVNNIDIRVVRNTITSIAFQNTQYECLKKFLIGPILIAFSKKNPGSAARLLKNFEKENLDFKVLAGVFQNQFFSQKNLDELAYLPTHEEAIAKFLNLIKEISFLRLYRTLRLIQNKKKQFF